MLLVAPGKGFYYLGASDATSRSLALLLGAVAEVAINSTRSKPEAVLGSWFLLLGARTLLAGSWPYY